MANNAYKVTGLTACNTPAATDKLLVSANAAGNAVSKSLTLGNLFANTSGNTHLVSNNLTVSTTSSTNNLLITKNTTPANSTATVISRQIWFDSDYIYVALSNNSIKRVALSSF